MTEPDQQLVEAVARLNETRFKLPDGFYSDADYGCNEDDPHSLICAILDSGPQGTEVMQELTATGYSVVETHALDTVLAAIRATDGECQRLRSALDEIMVEYREHDAAAIDVMFQIAKDAVGSEPRDRAALKEQSA